jgi:hypothetical protein
LYHSQFQQACIIFIRLICSSALPHRIAVVAAQFLHSIRKFLVVIDELARTADVDSTIPWCRGTTRTSAVATASTLRGVGAGSTAMSWSGDRCRHDCVGTLAANNTCTRDDTMSCSPRLDADEGEAPKLR